MNRLWRDIRLIPVVLLAMASLFVLKVTGLLFDNGYILASHQPPEAGGMNIVSADSVPAAPKIIIGKNSASDTAARQPSWAQEMFNFGGDNKDNKSDITGAVDGDANKSSGPPLKTSQDPPPPPKLEVGDTTIQLEPGHIISPGENAIIHRLKERRRELDSRSHELDMKENLIKGAEKRLETKIDELKDVETNIKNSTAKRDKAEADRLKVIVSMYETMKPKDAARIFDRLDINVLVKVSTAMKPRTMSEILAQMSPEMAEKLTVELANRAHAQKTESFDQLPKIQGKPAKP